MHAASTRGGSPSYTAYGQTENDYRTSRWSNFRESYRFTGKEDDVEVGLNYHGARYYSPALKRWMSADPVTIHEAGSDINPYSYGNGNPTANVDPDGREIITLLVVIGVSALVAGATSATVQYATTGQVDWGWKGVAGAALAGAIGGAVGLGAGSFAAQGLGLGVGASSAAIGGAVGGAAAGTVGTGVAGGSWSDVGKSALTGAVAGAVGGAVGVHAGSQNANGMTAFGGMMAGTGAGTGAGIGFGYAAWGQEPTWQSAGIAFASAFGGALASTALSKGYQAAAEADTAGQAGKAAGESARRSSVATTRRAMTEKYTTELGARIAGLPDYRLAEKTPPLVTCGGMGCWSSDGQVGMTVDASAAVSPGLGLEGIGYAVEFASDGVHAGPELVRRAFPDAGGDVTVHFYPDSTVTPADIRASQDVALDIGNFEAFVTIHPEKGLVGIGFGYGRDTNVANVDVTWSTTDLK